MSKEQPIEERIVDIDLSKEMQDSFLEYSYSVIYARALPDARDGLKPVHRRIIYQMGEMGLRPEKGHVKSARVVGEVMGKLHPHGDSAIYDALVRMAQSFSLRVPLIDGHGNFGSLDDGPAASRYTEAKLSIASILMNDGLDEDVVDYKPNYDAQLTEPEVLPAAFPNLLVNGSSGIAVGMATNMPPHNLREVINGAVFLLANPEATTKQLMKHIPGPDLPNGGIIVGLEGVIEAYDTGRGTFKTRARVSIESVSPRKQGIVITELPYLVGPEKVIEKIKDGVNSKKLQGISDVTDLTDRANGLRLVIELKTGYDPQTVLDLLYRFTPMEDSFGINNVALVDGRPQTLGLKDMLGVYLAHRIVVTRRRSENRLGKKQARLHLVEGLLLAIVSIDEVIQVIRASDEVEQARQKLMKVFDLSELQAEYILELRLRRLTKFSKIELETEKEALQKEIKALKKILGSDTELREVVSNELEEVAKKYGDDRRTTLMSTFEEVKPISNAKAATMSAQLADTPCVVVFTSSGMVGKTSVWDTTASAPAKRKKHDAIKTVIATTTRSDIGFLTTNGVMHRIHVGDVPALNDVFDLGSMVAANSFLGLPKSEKVLNVFELNDEINIAMGTAKGIVKRLSADFAPKAEFEVIALKPGDKLIGANLVEDEDEIVFVTNDAQLLRFKASVLNAQGRGAAGIAGINLSDSEVVSFSVVKPENENVVITAASSTGSLAGTDAGSVKITALSEFPAKGRATGGVRAHKFLRNEDQIYFAWAGPSEAIALTADGKPTELPEGQAKRDASGTKSPGIIGSVGHRLN